jgi:hypothetical protein
VSRSAVIAAAVAVGIALVIVAASALAGSARAADAGGTTVTTTDGAVRVEITRADCRRLVRHEPAEGVDYEPGVDVHGNEVAPAEVGGGVELDLPDRITIPIELDVLTGRRQGRDEPEAGTPETDDPDDVPDDADLGDRLIGEAQIGTVEVDVETGRATFNGQPLRSEAQRRIAEKCQEIRREGR